MQTLLFGSSRRLYVLTILLILGTRAAATFGEDSLDLKRCEVIPLPEQRTSLRIDGEEKVGWHFDDQNFRPFFFPFLGRSGSSLTRMGHPGAPDHDHHQSIWFAHNSVNGIDFWSNSTDARIRQKQWLCYQDGDDQAIMATALGWYDPAGREIMEQQTIVALIPMENNEYALELGITFKPAENGTPVTLGKTNFGLLAVRVAKTISAHFGGGQLTSSEGLSGEPMLFGKPARWMDYSGPSEARVENRRSVVVEGITYFDHPENPRYPTSWHVRDDGWMGASFCMHDEYAITHERPLVLRYLLHAHAGPYDHVRAERVHREFAARPAFALERSTKEHLQFEVTRRNSTEAGVQP